MTLHREASAVLADMEQKAYARGYEAGLKEGEGRGIKKAIDSLACLEKAAGTGKAEKKKTAGKARAARKPKPRAASRLPKARGIITGIAESGGKMRRQTLLDACAAAGIDRKNTDAAIASLRRKGELCVVEPGVYVRPRVSLGNGASPPAA